MLLQRARERAPAAEEEINEHGLAPETKRSTDPLSAGSPPGHLHPDHHLVLGLQAVIGNRAVAALLDAPRRPLDGPVRGEMEGSFGRSFSNVRLHSGPAVDAAAQGMGAAAFTVGPDIYLHSSVPGPEHDMGRLVLAEELAHVAQGVGTKGADRILDPSSAVEAEAHHAAWAAAHGERATVAAAPDAANATGRLLFPVMTGLAALGGVIYGGYKALSGETAEAKKASHSPTDVASPPPAEKGSLRPADKAKIAAQISVLASARDQVDSGKPATVRASFDGVKGLLFSIPCEGQAWEALTSAGNSLIDASHALLAVENRQGAKANARELLTKVSASIGALAAAAQKPPAAEPGQPDPERKALTPQEAAQLEGGAMAGIRFAEEQLVKDAPAYELVIARLATVRDTLEGFGAPPGIQEQIARHGREVGGALQTVLAVAGDEKNAREMAKGHLSSAISAIQYLTGAPATPETPPGDASSGGTPPGDASSEGTPPSAPPAGGE
jgi:hypothetical protein